MKCFGTNKSWREDLENMEVVGNVESNGNDVVCIEKNTLRMFVEQAIEEEFEVAEGLTGS